MKLSVVMACYNAEDTIEAQLKGLVNQAWRHPWEIVIADNRCTDNSIAIIKKYQKKMPNLRIVQAFERQGQPYALNVGIEAANGESIILCDSDDMAGKGWLTALGNALEKHDFVACRFELETLNSEFALGRGKTQINGLQKIWYAPYLPHAAGSSLAFKKSLFEQIGGFDESLPYLHDTDFCFKAQKLGIDIGFIPHAVMHVRYRDTFRGIFHQSKNYAEYNVLLSKRYSEECSIKAHVDIWVAYLQDWWVVTRKILKLKNKKVQGNLAWLLGRQTGRLIGAIKHRSSPI